MNDANNKEAACSNQRKRREKCDTGNESKRATTTSSSSSTCTCSQRQHTEWACSFCSVVQLHPPTGGRRPLLLPPVRWPMATAATKRKYLRRPFTLKAAIVDPTTITSFVMLALICLSSLLNNFAGLKPPISRRTKPQYIDNDILNIGNDLNEKQQNNHHFDIAVAEKVVTERMRNLQHSLVNFDNSDVLLSLPSSPQHINILLTGQQQRASPSRPGTPSPAHTLVAASSPTPFSSQQQAADDPTLMDYDAIDAFWRLDIEQEKSGALHEHFHYELPSSFVQQQQQQNQQPSAAVVEPATTWADHNRQYERDVQLLTEKSLLSAVPRLAPPTIRSNKNETIEHDGDWLSDILLEDDETDVTASGWTERWWKTVEDFSAVSVEQDEAGQQQQKGLKRSNLQLGQYGQHQFSNIRPKNEPPENFVDEAEHREPFYQDEVPQQSPFSPVDSLMKNTGDEAHDNLLEFDCSSSMFSNFDSSPFCHQFESNDDFLDYDEEEVKTGDENSATEAILRDMTATIPLIQNLDFYSNSEWEKRNPDVLENVPCTSNTCTDFGTSTSSSSTHHDHNQQICCSSSSLRCSSTSSGFGSFIDDLDDLPLSRANSSCTLLACDDEYKNNTDADDHLNFVDKASSSAARDETASATSTVSYSYRMEKLVPMPSSVATAASSSKRRRKMVHSNSQRQQKKKQNLTKQQMAKINKKGAKSSKFDYELELKRRQEEEEELIAISSISGPTTSSHQHQQFDFTKVKGKRGRKSKDNSLLNEHELPYSAEWLTAMPYSVYSELMNDFRLSAQQKALIKKIRRRGRNKLAAQKCRERRVNQKQEWESEGWSVEADEDEIIFMKEEEDDDEFGENLLNPANLSLYPPTSSQIDDEHQRHQDYSEFVHSTISARRRAIRVQV
ncbi:hypothetical protein niasHS_006021 [Heterodera schachtii]|uniref:BZIP domain-containing protein n=1 Tax=Heterodera schachtii TaxID=97005 RepID=A0ABD2JVQ7_HETSC